MSIKKLIGWFDKTLFYRKPRQNDVVKSVKTFKFSNHVPGVTRNRRQKIKTPIMKGIDLSKFHLGKEQKKELEKKIKKFSVRSISAAICVIMFMLIMNISGGFSALIGLGEKIDYFFLQNLNISGCERVSKKDVKELAGLDYNSSLLFLDKEALVEKITAHPWVENVRIDTGLPSTLDITIKEFIPEAIIALMDVQGQRLNYINRKGVVFTSVAVGERLDYPVITGFKNIQTVKKHEDITQEIFQFLKQTKRNNPRLPNQAISEIHLDANDELIVYLVEHPFPIYFGRGDMKKKYRRLLTVLEVLKRQKNNPLIADVDSIRMNYLVDKVLVSRN